MIDMPHAKHLLDSVIGECLKDFGYSRQGALTYAKPFEQAEGYVLCGMRKDARGFFAASCSVGLRFPAFANILGESWGQGIHINVPVHLLSAGQGFREWQFSSEEELLVQKSDICQTLVNSVIPFLDSHTNLQKLCSRLLSPDPKDWYVLPPEKRVVLLAASQNALGDKVAALNTVNAALAVLEGAPPKKRMAIESLKAKLQAEN